MEVGNLNTRLTATDNGMKATLDTGAANVERFGGTGNKAGETFVKFNTHMLESRKTLGTFAAAAGTTVGPLMHLVHAFGMFGPVGAVALGGIELIRWGIEETNKVLEAGAASTKKFHDQWNNFTLENIGKEFSRLRAERMELEELVKPGHELATPATRQAQKSRIEEIKSEEARLTGKYKELKDRGATKQHIETAVKTENLGVFKLEHSAQDPQTQAVDKNTVALNNLANVVQGIEQMHKNNTVNWGTY